MGYSTDFTGRFDLDRPLTPEHAAYLRKFAETRRMKRDPAKLPPDPTRDAVGLPVGPEGAYFVGGQEDDASVVDHNNPPDGQPRLWCQWVPTADNAGIEWDGGEKFCHYVAWLEYLITHFLAPWGYRVNGAVAWDGEDSDDRGTITVRDNVVSTAAVPTADEAADLLAACEATLPLLRLLAAKTDGAEHVTRTIAMVEAAIEGAQATD